MVDSYAPFIFELRILLEDKTTVSIPTHEFVQSVSITGSRDVAWKGSITLFDKDEGYLAEVFLSSGMTSRLLMRWNWDTSQQSIEDAPIYRARITKFTPTFSHTGDTIDIEFASSPAVVAVLDRKERKGWPSGSYPSAIVKEIAESRNWTTVDTDGVSTIDTNDEVLTREVSYAGESDLKFIKSKLLPYTLNSDGSHYEFFIDFDNIAHFRPVDSGKSGKTIRKTYMNIKDPMGDVIEFSPSDNSLYSAMWGASTTQYISSDSVTGTATQDKTTATKGGVKDKTTKTPDESYTVKVAKEGTRQARVPIISRDKNEMVLMAQERYSRLNAAKVQATLTVKGTHDLKMLDLVDVRFVTKLGTNHWLAGVFRVYTVTHTFGQEFWKTTYTLGRSGVSTTAPGTVKKANKTKKIENKPRSTRGTHKRQVKP